MTTTETTGTTGQYAQELADALNAADVLAHTPSDNAWAVVSTTHDTGDVTYHLVLNNPAGREIGRMHVSRQWNNTSRVRVMPLLPAGTNGHDGIVLLNADKAVMKPLSGSMGALGHRAPLVKAMARRIEKITGDWLALIGRAAVWAAGRQIDTKLRNTVARSLIEKHSGWTLGTYAANDTDLERHGEITVVIPGKGSTGAGVDSIVLNADGLACRTVTLDDVPLGLLREIFALLGY